MNNSEIQNTLVEIENNLKSLESARKQVKTVVGSSEELIKAVHKTSSSIELLNGKIQDKNTAVTTEMSKLIGSLKADLELTSSKLKNESQDITNEFKAKTNEVIERLKSLNNHISNTKQKLKSLDFDRYFRELNSDLLSFREKSISSFQEQKGITNKIEEDNKKLSSEVDKISKEISLLEANMNDKISQDISSLEATISEKIKLLAEKQNSTSNKSIVIIVLLIVSVILQFILK